jgi:hypothetical protein
VFHKRLKFQVYKLRLRHENKYIHPHKKEVNYSDSMLSEIDEDEDLRPVTVAVRSKPCNFFARSDARIVGSNPTQDMDVCCVVLCLGTGLATS